MTAKLVGRLEPAFKAVQAVVEKAAAAPLLLAVTLEDLVGAVEVGPCYFVIRSP